MPRMDEPSQSESAAKSAWAELEVPDSEVSYPIADGLCVQRRKGYS